MNELESKKEEKSFTSLGKNVFIGGVSILLLQAIMLLFCYFLQARIRICPCCLPPLSLERFLFFFIYLIIFIPLLYIFLLSVYKLERKSTLVRTFKIIFWAVLVINIFEVICIFWDTYRTWFLFNGERFQTPDIILGIYQFMQIDEGTVFFLSRYLQLILWIIFIMFDHYSDKIRIIRLLLYSQFWIVFSWFMTLPIIYGISDFFRNSVFYYHVFSFITLTICQIIAIFQVYIMTKDKSYAEAHLKIDIRKIMHRLFACLLILLIIPTSLFYAASHPKSFNKVDLRLTASKNGSELIIKVKTNLDDGALIYYGYKQLNAYPYKSGGGKFRIKNGEGEVKILGIPKGPIEVQTIFSIGIGTEQPKSVIEKYGYFGKKIKKREKTENTSIAYTTEEDGYGREVIAIAIID